MLLVLSAKRQSGKRQSANWKSANWIRDKSN